MIIVNLDKAKNIAHEMRRANRAEEFAPLDIKATIPSEAAAAEADRATIRTKYENIQNEIDEVADVDGLKQIVVDNGFVGN